MATIVVSDSLKPSGRNKPLDQRTVVPTEADIENIGVPFVGMIVYVEDTEKYFSVKSLKESNSGVANAKVDRYEPLTSSSSGGGSSEEPSFEKVILSTGWSNTPDSDGFYSIDIKHNLNTEFVQVYIIDTDTKSSVLDVFTVTDANNIKLFNDEKINCKIKIK